MGDDRPDGARSLERFFDLFGEAILPTLQYVCSDMWRPYLEVIRRRAGDAVHVLDRYRIMARMNKAIDEVRASEARRLKADGYEPILKHSRWCLLKRATNLTGKQTVKLRELLEYNLKAVRAYLLREDFQRFWEYQTPTWAGRFLRDGCARTMRSRLEPMKKVARSLRRHEALLLNWFRAKGEISAGIVGLGKYENIRLFGSVPATRFASAGVVLCRYTSDIMIARCRRLIFHPFSTKSAAK